MFPEGPLIWWGLAGMVFFGAPVGSLVSRWFIARRLGGAQERADHIIESARKTAEESLGCAKQDIRTETEQQRGRLDKEEQHHQREHDRQDENLRVRESALDRKFDALDRRDQALVEKENRLTEMKLDAQNLCETLKEQTRQFQDQCEKLAGMTVQEGREALLENLEKELAAEKAVRIRHSESQTRESASRSAKQILSLAIQKSVADVVGETTISVVLLSGDDVKGRIIGREGRNIRALESRTGCNFIIDDTPGAVVLSCFDPLRREIAKISLERLVADGRIHPGRIEEVVSRVEQEMEDVIARCGEEAAFDLGIHGLDTRLQHYVGLMKFRSSYGQNLLEHSCEVARIMGTMAAELGVDVQCAKRAGLLHDIGKVVSDSGEGGGHACVAARLVLKLGESQAVAHAIGAHHEDQAPHSVCAVLLQAADAASAARPGARRESLDNYLKRMKDLEELAASFEGVKKVYAIQAGREIRIMVDPEKVDDARVTLLAHDIARRIESDLEYSGQVQVTVLREFRASGEAK